MTKDWQRLADAVLRRRAELGRLTQADISHRAGISLDRIQAIEGAKADRYRRVTLMALEQALEWAPGSIDAVLSGGEPTSTRTAQDPLTEALAEAEALAGQLDDALKRRLGTRRERDRKAVMDLVRGLLEDESPRPR